MKSLLSLGIRLNMNRSKFAGNLQPCDLFERLILTPLPFDDGVIRFMSNIQREPVSRDMDKDITFDAHKLMGENSLDSFGCIIIDIPGKVIVSYQDVVPLDQFTVNLNSPTGRELAYRALKADRVTVPGLSWKETVSLRKALACHSAGVHVEYPHKTLTFQVVYDLEIKHTPIDLVITNADGSNPHWHEAMKDVKAAWDK